MKRDLIAATVSRLNKLNEDVTEDSFDITEEDLPILAELVLEEIQNSEELQQQILEDLEYLYEQVDLLESLLNERDYENKINKNAYVREYGKRLFDYRGPKGQRDPVVQRKDNQLQRGYGDKHVNTVVGRRALQQKSSDEVASNIRDIERNIKHRRGFKTWSQMAKYNRVKNESFDLTEGNPLARVKKHIDTGRHFSGISAERSNLSPAENKKRHAALQKAVKKMGFGYREATGKWEGGSEKSLMVSAKKTGQRHGNRLKKRMMALGRKFGQDAVLHHGGKSATLHGTNKTGFPGKGKKVGVGKVKYNKNAPFQTEFRRGKSFTTEETRNLTEGPVKAANKL